MGSDKDYDRILELVLEGTIKPGEYENMLVSRYPVKMIEYYKVIIEDLIDQKNRKSYQQAIEVILKLKKIYIGVLKDTIGWKRYMADLISKYSRLKALQDELKNSKGIFNSPGSK